MRADWWPPRPLGDATKASPGGGGMYNGSSARTQQSSLRARRRRSSRWPPTPAARRCWITTISASASCRRRRKSPATTSWATTASNDKLDGRYRRIKLQPRPRNCRPRSARSTTARATSPARNSSKFNSSDKERQLQEALMLGDPMTDLSVALEVDYFRMARDRYFVPVTVKIPGSGIGTGQARRRGNHQARFHRRGARFQGPGAGQRARLPGDQAQGRDRRPLSKRTLAYDTGFTLAPGTYTLKFLTRENETGKMGTFETKFVVPDLTTQMKYLPISSVVLSNQRQDLSSGARHRREGQEDCSPQNPLVQDNQSWCPASPACSRRSRTCSCSCRPTSPTPRPRSRWSPP